MIIGVVSVFIVTVMLILNFVHCEITACDSDNKQSLILSYLTNAVRYPKAYHSITCP